MTKQEKIDALHGKLSEVLSSFWKELILDDPTGLECLEIIREGVRQFYKQTSYMEQDE